MTTKNSLTLLVCGDVNTSADVRALFEKGSPEAVFGQLAGRIKSADLSIANLECALSDTAPAREKIGPVLRGRERDAAVLKNAGFDLLGCANNHIKDCGATGTLDTLAACARAGLSTTGAGRHAQESAQPARIEKNGWSIGVFAVAEQEFNTATSDGAGAHVFDPLNDLERLRLLKETCDYVIVLYHGGIEYYPFPSPSLQNTCRALVRNGADLVLCQHSHVIGTLETYEGGEILYGQGNTLFGHKAGKPTWNVGLAVEVALDQGADKKAKITLVPIGCESDGQVNLLPDHKAQECLDSLALRSKQATDPAWLQENWGRFCDSIAPQQIPFLLGLGRWLARANRILRGKVVRMFFGRKQLLTTLNVIRCDAHRDVALTALQRTLDTE